MGRINDFSPAQTLGRVAHDSMVFLFTHHALGALSAVADCYSQFFVPPRWGLDIAFTLSHTSGVASAHLQCGLGSFAPFGAGFVVWKEYPRM
jgi:hypothetical protein